MGPNYLLFAVAIGCMFYALASMQRHLSLNSFQLCLVESPPDAIGQQLLFVTKNRVVAENAAKIESTKRRAKTKSQRSAPVEYLPAPTALALRVQLREQGITNAGLADFLSRVFPKESWREKKAAKYLGGERRFTMTAYFAICEHFELDSTDILIAGYEYERSSFNESPTAKRLRRLRCFVKERSSKS